MYIDATLCIGACTALASCTQRRPHSFLQRRRARPARECRMWELWRMAISQCQFDPSLLNPWYSGRTPRSIHCLSITWSLVPSGQHQSWTISMSSADLVVWRLNVLQDFVCNFEWCFQLTKSKLEIIITSQIFKNTFVFQHWPRSTILALCERNPSVTGGFLSQRPVMRSFDVFYLRLSKRSVEQAIETPMIWDAIALTVTSLQCLVGFLWLIYQCRSG